VLADLYRRILRDTVDTETFNKEGDISKPGPAFGALIDRYVNKQNIGVLNVHDRYGAKSNLTKGLLSATMTWKQMFQGLRVLEVTRFTISMGIKRPHKPMTYHELRVIISDEPDDDLGKEE
jgi:hypothetical protein